MATVQLLGHPPTLRLTLTGGERLMSLRPSPVDLPVAAVTGARAEPGWTSQVLGMRTGTVVSGFLKLGSFTHPDGTRRLVAMRRGMPLLRVRLAGQDYDELLLSTPQASDLAAALDPATRVTS